MCRLRHPPGVASEKRRKVCGSHDRWITGTVILRKSPQRRGFVLAAILRGQMRQQSGGLSITSCRRIEQHNLEGQQPPWWELIGKWILVDRRHVCVSVLLLYSAQLGGQRSPLSTTYRVYLFI